MRNKALVIKPNDTLVLVISIAALLSLQQLGLYKICMKFGEASTLTWIAKHSITSASTSSCAAHTLLTAPLPMLPVLAAPSLHPHHLGIAGTP